MALKIALAGNPNCGKTTMFNALTGANQYVGNWPGVTVEKKEGKLKASSSGEEIIITDLPGIYSLSPYTLEEVVSRDYLLKERPQAIINLVDATNIERNLYLTTQVLELGIPVVIALNMADLLAKSGDRIDTKKLGELFGCQVVETSALKGTGLKEVVDKAVEAAKKNAWRAPAHIFSLEVENSISRVEEALGSAVDEKQKRWYAIKLLEQDEKVMEQLRLPASILSAVSAEAARLEKEMDDDTESIITDARYNYIGEVIEKAVKKSPRQMSTSDKIDRIVTNRILGLPIFAAVMWFVYYISVTTLGTMGTDWANDTFGGAIMEAAGSFLGSLEVGYQHRRERVVPESAADSQAVVERTAREQGRADCRKKQRTDYRAYRKQQQPHVESVDQAAQVVACAYACACREDEQSQQDRRQVVRQKPRRRRTAQPERYAYDECPQYGQ